MIRDGRGKRHRGFGWLLILALAVPVAVEAASPEAKCKVCICLPDQRESLDARDVVFSGRVIGQRIGAQGIASTFLVLEAWKGVESDTITVEARVSGNCGAMYSMGETFLVFADERDGRAVTGECDGALWLRGARSQLEGLGVPARTFTSEGREHLAAGATLPGDEIARPDTTGVALALLVLDVNGVAWNRPVRIGDRERATDLRGRVSFSDLPPGFYRGEVELEQAAHEFYVLLDCGDVNFLQAMCRWVRKTIRVHEVAPGDPLDLVRAGPTFTPWTDGARLLNGERVEARIEAETPGSRVTVGLEHDRTWTDSDGALAVWIHVDEEGVLLNAQIARSSGREETDRTVLAAFEEAVFEPAQLQGARIPIWMQLVVSMADR